VRSDYCHSCAGWPGHDAIRRDHENAIRVVLKHAAPAILGSG
jgi:hypothetical protein